MKKQLPQIKKSLKSFIIGEDAKVIDKTTTKIALLVTFSSLSFMSNISDVNAKGHGSHARHKNDLDIEDFKIDEENEFFSESIHANHYNHKDGGGNC